MELDIGVDTGVLIWGTRRHNPNLSTFYVHVLSIKVKLGPCRFVSWLSLCLNSCIRKQNHRLGYACG